ncbi:MAG: UDP-glucose 4-epimerase, partial [Acidimicrobiaceae bacterium]|nr:UDP-glucose 4-epimerase [Acidimicrobiaceae bacterium]
MIPLTGQLPADRSGTVRYVLLVKVLIAGGAGFIGSTIASACLDNGMTPVILDNLATGRAEFARDRIFYQGDIADGPLIDKIFTEHPEITAVVHAAA